MGKCVKGVGPNKQCVQKVTLTLPPPPPPSLVLVHSIWNDWVRRKGAAFQRIQGSSQ